MRRTFAQTIITHEQSQRERSFHYDGEGKKNKTAASPVRAGRFHKASGDKVLFYLPLLFCF